MNTAATTIISRLNEVFEPMDAEVLKATQEWAEGRALALCWFKASDKYAALQRSPAKLYTRLFRVAGSKTWYEVIDRNNPREIAEFAVKQCAAEVAKRNTIIATELTKLAKVGVSEVVGEDFAYNFYGFTATFVVVTSTRGCKTVTAEVARAGGNTTTRPHLRVLVKVR